MDTKRILLTVFSGLLAFAMLLPGCAQAARTTEQTVLQTASLATELSATPSETKASEEPSKGKTMLAVGDMVSVGAASDGGAQRGWVEIVGEELAMTEITNAANADASVTAAAGGSLISGQIEENKGKSYDLVLIEGGVNDALKAVDIGRIVPKSAAETKAEDLDEQTFAGGYEKLLMLAKGAFPDAVVACVIAGKMNSQKGCVSDMRRFAEIVRLAGEKWGAPVLDLYNDGAFEEEYKPKSNKNVKNDRMTPNAAGHEIYGRYVSAFLREIDGREFEPTFKIGPGMCDIGSVLSEKVVVYYGDSICDKTSQEDPERQKTRFYSYAGRISEMYGTKELNRSKSGASLSTVRQGNLIITQTKADLRRKIDMIVIEGGVNDAWDSAPVGKPSDMTVEDFDASRLDRSTMAGGLEELLWKLTTAHPEAVIVYMINFKLNSGAGMLNNMTKYVETIKVLCDKWGVPYLDLYNDGWFNARFDIRSTTHSGDGVHPNGAGYDMLSPVLAAFMADTYLAAKAKSAR